MPRFHPQVRRDVATAIRHYDSISDALGDDLPPIRSITSSSCFTSRKVPKECQGGALPKVGRYRRERLPMGSERNAQAEPCRLPSASSFHPSLSCGLRRGRATSAGTPRRPLQFQRLSFSGFQLLPTELRILPRLLIEPALELAERKPRGKPLVARESHDLLPSNKPPLLRQRPQTLLHQIGYHVNPITLTPFTTRMSWLLTAHVIPRRLTRFTNHPALFQSTINNQQSTIFPRHSEDFLPRPPSPCIRHHRFQKVSQGPHLPSIHRSEFKNSPNDCFTAGTDLSDDLKSKD
jgi:hypothetical protein